SVTEISAAHRASPFRVLISCIISLRTKDEVTAAASKRLFELADTPKELLRLRTSTIEKAIFPCGFYRNKAKTLREISKHLIDRFEGRVPDTIEDLLTLKGVGRKTANLVVTLGHAKPGICVDIHVHRITNRWGYVKTKNPDETEAALRAKLPKRYWIPINDLLVVYGQKVCRPVSPFCSECGIAKHCAKVGVEKFR
ncbi:MAG: endonuclease III, partial [Candidatus Omnitrophica bacterium]|nr:endonuclease III [Candidatus Omnitrophota bacterium]